MNAPRMQSRWMPTWQLIGAVYSLLYRTAMFPVGLMFPLSIMYMFVGLVRTLCFLILISYTENLIEFHEFVYAFYNCRPTNRLS